MEKMSVPTSEIPEGKSQDNGPDLTRRRFLKKGAKIAGLAAAAITTSAIPEFGGSEAQAASTPEESDIERAEIVSLMLGAMSEGQKIVKYAHDTFTTKYTVRGINIMDDGLKTFKQFIELDIPEKADSSQAIDMRWAAFGSLSYISSLTYGKTDNMSKAGRFRLTHHLSEEGFKEVKKLSIATEMLHTIIKSLVNELTGSKPTLTKDQIKNTILTLQKYTDSLQ